MTTRATTWRSSLSVAALAGLALTLAATPGAAFGLFSKSTVKPQAVAAANDARAAGVARLVRQALDEQRYVDAGSLIDEATVGGVRSPELVTLAGEVFLARGRFQEALDDFSQIEGDASQKAAALQGKGIALSMLGRSDEALAMLKAATVLDKSQWRAWNALGREYDLRRDWHNAVGAYNLALAAPGVKAAVVLNNRGFSLLLQNQAALAAQDFVAALSRDPGLAAARTNLRIALAWQGAYARAAVTGAGDDRAAVLNNVGLAAALHGDYEQAEKYLNEAMAAKGEYYNRASENLQLTHGLAERKQTASAAPASIVH